MDEKTSSQEHFLHMTVPRSFESLPQVNVEMTARLLGLTRLSRRVSEFSQRTPNQVADPPNFHIDPLEKHQASAQETNSTEASAQPNQALAMVRTRRHLSRKVESIKHL